MPRARDRSATGRSSSCRSTRRCASGLAREEHRRSDPGAARARLHLAPACATGGRSETLSSVRPLIGISSYGRAGERQTFSVPCEYVDAVRMAGGVPIVLPPVEGETPEGLDAVAGLILPGGGDVDPPHYRPGPHH